MTEAQLPATQAIPSRWASWGKVSAILCLGVVIVAIIGLILFQQPTVIVNATTSKNQLISIRTMLVSLGTAAFVVMLIIIAIADTTANNRIRQLVIGFVGLPVLNSVLVLLLMVISQAMPFCNGFGDCLGRGLGGLVLLGLVDIGIVIFLGIFRRWWILLGTAAVFVIACTLYLALFGPHL